MSLLMQNRGRISFKAMFWILLVFLIVHVAIKLVPMYMDAEEMKDEMTQKARLAQVLTDDDIIRDLAKKAKDQELPLTAESFVLERDSDSHRMKISTKGGWDVEVHFLFNLFPEYTNKTYHFEPVIDETYSTKL